jgi:hypothetical protein
MNRLYTFILVALILFLLLILLICVLPTPAHATTYYVRLSGNDTNTGTSWAQAWQTVGRMDTSIVAGDSVIFGAGRYLNSSINPPLNTDPSKLTVYIDSAYLQNGVGLKAEINAGDSITGWTAYDLTGGKNIWKARWDTTKYAWTKMEYDRIHTLEQDTLYLFHPLCGMDAYCNSDYDDSTDIALEGEIWMNRTNRYIYAWIYDNQNPNDCEMLGSPRQTINFAGSGYYGGSWIALQNYVIFKGLKLYGGDSNTIMFRYDSGGSDSIIFDHCNFKFCASDQGGNPAAIYHAATYELSWSRKIIARSCRFALCYGSGYLAAHGGGGLAFYAVQEALIESCYFDNLQGAGISFKNGTSYADGGVNADSHIVRFNQFVGGITEHAIWVGPKNKDMEIYGNIFSDISGIAIELRETSGDNSTNCIRGGNKIYNNTFYNVGNAIVMKPYHCGQDNLIKYNVFYDVKNTTTKNDTPDSHKMLICFPGGTNEDPVTETYYTIDSNIYKDPTDPFLTYAYDGNRNWGTWQSYSFDLHSDTVDPGLTDPANGVFTRLSASGEMNQIYGGKTWTIYGAVQNEAETPRPVKCLRIRK